MVRLLGLSGVVLLVLTGCLPSETWNERLTLVIETPQGEVRGAVVQRIDWEGTGAIGAALFNGVDPSSASVKVTGEALAVEVVPGRWLFALLKGGEGWQGEPGLNAGVAIAVPRGHFAKSSEGVREVDPEDLAAVFGEGVRLKAVTLEITEKAVTAGRLDNLPGWLGPIQRLRWNHLLGRRWTTRRSILRC